MASNLSGMKVEKNIGRHHHDAVTWRVLVAVAKDRPPDVAFDNIALDLIQKVHDRFR